MTVRKDSKTTAETGAEIDVTPIEQDVTSAPPAPALTVEPQVDPRASALAALVSGTADPVITADAVVEIDTSNVLDFGGKTKAVVQFSRYHQMVDGLFTHARKGDVISTDAESLKRGVRVGALKKLGE